VPDAKTYPDVVKWERISRRREKRASPCKNLSWHHRRGRQDRAAL